MLRMLPLYPESCGFFGLQSRRATSEQRCDIWLFGLTREGKKAEAEHSYFSSLRIYTKPSSAQILTF